MPMRKIRRRPSRSAMRPPSSRKPPNMSAYALITHWRFACEKPRSILIEGSATFTIAMSRTTMNCTALSRPSASHLRRSEATISVSLSCVLSVTACNLAASTCKKQVQSSQQQVNRYTASREQALRPVVSKRYDQYCPVAHALGLVGERWALLIVRELLHGPQRYTDLTANLPKIGTNILSSRLKDLEACGILARRRLPPPAASQVYELTESGQAPQPG